MTSLKTSASRLGGIARASTARARPACANFAMELTEQVNHDKNVQPPMRLGAAT
jgi:hypothetical protein